MVEPPDFTSYLLCHLRNSLHPVTPDNAWTLRITAAAGTELADAFSPGTLIQPHVAAFVPRQKMFTTLSAFLHHAAWLVQAPAH